MAPEIIDFWVIFSGVVSILSLALYLVNDWRNDA